MNIMNYIVTYTGGLSTEAEHLNSKKSIVTDAPKDNNGLGRTFSPTDLTVVSLVSCMLTCIGIENEVEDKILGLRAEATKIMGVKPRRIKEIEITFKIDKSGLTASEVERMEVIATNCPVMKSLHPEIKVHMNFNALIKG